MNDQFDDTDPAPPAPEPARPRRAAPATNVLILINILVFAAMVLGGVSLMAPDTKSLLKWGADFGPWTMSTQPWRLVTSFFVHIGLIHVAVNMYSLYIVGPAAERIFGSPRFLVFYLLSGLGGGIASIAWNPIAVGAGASGAIFGVVGALLGFFFRRRNELVPGIFRENVSSLLRVVFLNVVLGLSIKGIDNSAHLGGLATGFLAGFVLAPTRDYRRLNALEYLGLAVLVGVLGLGAMYGKQRAAGGIPASVRELTMEEMNVDQLNILYSPEIPADAMKLFSAELEAIGYTSNRATVMVTKTKDGIEIGFLMKEGAWSDDSNAAYYKRKGQRLASAAFPDQHVEVQLYDKNLKPHRTITLDGK